MTLLDARMDNSYIVFDIKLPKDTMRRLESLGLTSGTPVNVLNKRKNGASIIKLRGTRFAIGKAIAEGIIVEEGKRL